LLGQSEPSREWFKVEAVARLRAAKAIWELAKILGFLSGHASSRLEHGITVVWRTQPWLLSGL
jgi:hypothetical protein